MVSSLKRKKIALVIKHLSDRIGGGQRVVVDIANTLDENGYSVSIWTYEDVSENKPFYDLSDNVAIINHYEASIMKKIERKFLRFFDDNFPDILNKFRHYLKYYSWSKSISKETNDTNQDVIISFMPPAISAVAMAKKSIKSNIFIIASNHNSPDNEYHNPNRWDKGVYAQGQRKKDLFLFDKVTVLLPEFKEWYKKNLNLDTVVIPNILHPIKDELKSDGLDNIIVAVGRLSDAKAYDRLIESWSVLESKYSEWSLKIYGDGDLYASLKNKADKLGIKKEVFLGRSNNTDKIYKEASILAHPAKFEGFGLVVGEAFAANVPVVGDINCPGVNELVKNDFNGLLVSFDNGCDEFTGALELLMNDHEKRKKLAINAGKSIKNYGKEEVFKKWEALF